MELNIPEFPYDLFAELKTNSKNDLNEFELDFPLVYEGNRHSKLTSIAGTLYKNMSHKPELCKAFLQSINETRFIPPLLESEVLSIDKGARQYHPGSNKKGISFTPLTVSELMEVEVTPFVWLINSLIPWNSITVLSGNPGAYKTWIMCYMAICISSGKPFFNMFDVRSAGVLIIDEESGIGLLQQRFKQFNLSKDLPIYILSLSGFMANEDLVEKIINLCKEKKIKVIFIDSLVRIHSGDENSAKDISQVFKLLKEFIKNDLTVILTHHNRKQGFQSNNPSQSMRGSSDILASIDNHVAIERDPKEPKVTFRQTKLRYGLEVSPFSVKILSDGKSFNFQYEGEVNASKSAIQDTKAKVLEHFKREDKEMYKKEVYELVKKSGLDVGKNTINLAIDELSDDGYLEKRKGGKNKTYFKLVKDE